MASVRRYRRGDIFADVDRPPLQVQVLGGPIVLSGSVYYTIRILEGGEDAWPPVTNGSTRIWAGAYLDMCDFIGHDTRVRNRRPPCIIPVGHCPECDEPDMIFYNEDYICAWCREHLDG